MLVNTGIPSHSCQQLQAVWIFCSCTSKNKPIKLVSSYLERFRQGGCLCLLKHFVRKIKFIFPNDDVYAVLWMDGRKYLVQHWCLCKYRYTSSYLVFQFDLIQRERCTSSRPMNQLESYWRLFVFFRLCKLWITFQKQTRNKIVTDLAIGLSVSMNDSWFNLKTWALWQRRFDIQVVDCVVSPLLWAKLA